MPKAQASRGVWEQAPPENVLDFNSLKSTFAGFSESFRQDIGQISTRKVFFIIKNVFQVEIWPISCLKTVETSVDPRLGKYCYL